MIYLLAKRHADNIIHVHVHVCIIVRKIYSIIKINFTITFCFMNIYVRA